MSIELKVKSKHLGKEAEIIRFEENKLRRQIDWLESRQQDASAIRAKWMSLKQHRREDVRNENRATFLARAFIAGKAYKAVEAKVHDKGMLRYLITGRVLDMVAKYGNEPIPRVWNATSRKHELEPEKAKQMRNQLLSWIES